MIFEPGKYYKHTTGEMIKTLIFADTTMWGMALLAEKAGKRSHTIVVVGTDSKDYAENWVEVTIEDWERCFSE